MPSVYQMVLDIIDCMLNKLKILKNHNTTCPPFINLLDLIVHITAYSNFVFLLHSQNKISYHIRKSFAFDPIFIYNVADWKLKLRRILHADDTLINCSC